MVPSSCLTIDLLHPPGLSQGSDSADFVVGSKKVGGNPTQSDLTPSSPGIEANIFHGGQLAVIRGNSGGFGGTLDKTPFLQPLFDKCGVVLSIQRRYVGQDNCYVARFLAVFELN